MHELERGLVMVFPGIEGGPQIMRPQYRAMRDGGTTQAIRFFDWQRISGMANLMDYAGNRRKAAELAQSIVDYRAAHPKATIDLVGYSGGGGMAVFAAEALPPDIHLRNVVLAQAALSPDYDLTEVLRRVDGKLVNLYSPADWLILGAGTTVWGTMERKHGDSCGKIGFDVLRAVPDETQRAHFMQRGWQSKNWGLSQDGSHVQLFSYEWNRANIAPFVKAAVTVAPDQAVPPGPSAADTHASVPPPGEH